MPCTKLRNGTCPVAKGDSIDCNKRRRTGCPYMGAKGEIDPKKILDYLMNPAKLGLFIRDGLYDSQGVPKNR